MRFYIRHHPVVAGVTDEAEIEGAADTTGGIEADITGIDVVGAVISVVEATGGDAAGDPDDTGWIAWPPVLGTGTIGCVPMLFPRTLSVPAPDGWP